MMDVDPPNDLSHTHESVSVTVPQTPGHSISQCPTHNRQSTNTTTTSRTLYAPTPHRRIGGGLAIQGPFPQTPSPTPSPSSSPHPTSHTWRESASALQEDIAAQFEAEDRLGAPTLKRKRADDDGCSHDDEGEEVKGMGQSEVDRLLDNLVSWLAERERKRRET
ncbi:hypothetical protein ABKA04_001954 [Annulohypoxylon sp. FPYF3050]